MSRLVALQRRIETWLGFLCALIVAFLMFLTAADVMMRSLFNSPIVGAYELTQFSLAGVAFLSFAYVQQHRGHITIEFIAERVSLRARAYMDTIALLILLPVLAIMVWQSGQNAAEAWRVGDVTTGLIQFPIAPAKAMVPLGTTLLALRVVTQLVQNVAGLVHNGSSS